MNFTHYDLGQQSRGAVVEVHLKGSAANVRLMDSSNFQNYRRGGRHNYYGGLIQRSPARLGVPRSGHWHVTVDMQGLRGTTRSSVRVDPPGSSKPLPRYKAPLSPGRSVSLGDIASTAASQAADHRDVFATADRAYDVFVSYASEDKDAVARPLAKALRAEGLVVWYDDFELRIGDSLRRKIDFGIANSRFGIVVLSASFFSKNWPQYELDGLVTRELSGEQSVLPIWHEISHSELCQWSPSLADKVARDTSQVGIAEIAREIADVIRSQI